MDQVVLGQALALIALIAASGEYAAIIRRRADQRTLAEACLIGLVRIEIMADGLPRVLR